MQSLFAHKTSENKMCIQSNLNFVMDFPPTGKGELKHYKYFSLQVEFSFMSLPLLDSEWPDSSDCRRTPAVTWCQTDPHEPLKKALPAWTLT